MHVHIHSGIYRLVESIFIIHCRAMQVVYMLDVHPITDYETIESPFFAKNIFHQPWIGMTGNAVQFIMSCHKAIHTGIYGRLKGGQEYLPECPFRNVCGRAVRSVYRLAASNKMLGTSQHIFRLSKPVSLIPAHGSHAQ